MDAGEPVRWGVLGTANIARGSFLPSLRETDDGVAYLVAGRTLQRAEHWAFENQVEHAVEGYQSLVADERVEAVYIALPNSLHAEWTMACLRAGKAVLCEKPLCTSVRQTEEVLAVAQATGRPLWEAFIFPFNEQTARVRQIMAQGGIGELVEIQSNFHFQIRSRENIRLSAELEGGSLNDVGCYCIRLADLLFESKPTEGKAIAVWAPEGVDAAMQGVLSYPDERRLAFSCGMFRPQDTFARIIGTAGEIRLTNPFHPRSHDTLELRRNGDVEVEGLGLTEPPFTPAVRHINAVLRGREEPRNLAVDEAMATAIGLELARENAREAGTHS